MNEDQMQSEPGECDGEPAIKVLMMPRDTNVHGTIFGGVLLSHIDQAGAVHARRMGFDRVVTVAMQAVEFKLPVSPHEAAAPTSWCRWRSRASAAWPSSS